MKRFSLVIAVFLFSACNILFAQDIQVKGTVTELGTDVPMAFVSVHLKGTTRGTTTLDNGSYVINAPSNGTLVFSFVGYKTVEVPVENRSVVDVKMEYDAVTLGEVVMVAYGTAPKESITGSISSVNTKAIEKRPVSSVSGVLEGQAAGVQVNNTYGEPGSDATIRIRGFGSVNGSNAPLYVVDGVPFSGNISDLNPQDIENISVLKDAASSALFGNRASNGVILIST
ncbi:MAG: SusC/RagA family TonB-linked outer membrane protein, partial [Bacteroidia bacterium]|nr:SusC/RagA family TonB-linked outer membrane protein [Bacteroidia bacterium]